MPDGSSSFSTCSLRVPCRSWLAPTLLALSMITASPISANPELTFDPVPLGDGLAGWNVGIAFDDEEALSTFVDVSFEGRFNHLLYDGVAVDTDVDAAEFDGLLGYEAALDSYFITSVWPNVVILEGGEVMSVIYDFAAGSGVGNPVDDFIELAYLVLPEGESLTYSAIVSRQGVNYTLMPEPSPSLLALVAIGTLAALRRREGKLGDRARSTMAPGRSPQRRHAHLMLGALLTIMLLAACSESSTESLESASPTAVPHVSSTPETLSAQSGPGPSTASQPASATGAVHAEESTDRTEASAQPGDANGDGVVDDTDYTIWKDNYGRTVEPGTLGDYNFDGRVDGADYTIWADAVIASLACAAYFPNGVAAGDVDQSSVVLWARAESEGTVRFEWGREPDFFGSPDGFRDVVVSNPNVPAKVDDISGLLSGTQYYYRACRGGTCPTSVTPSCEARGSFRTPFADGHHGLRFGVSSCWRGDLKPFVSIENVPDHDLDFFVALGDTVYADSVGSGGRAGTLESYEDGSPLDEFRDNHKLAYSQVNSPDDNMFALARASTAFFVDIDDHEIVDNWSGGATASSQKDSCGCLGNAVLNGSPVGDCPRNVCFCPVNDPRVDCDLIDANETQLFSDAVQAFHEYNPIHEERYGQTGDPRTEEKTKLYRHRTFGKDAALFMLDARTFRDEADFSARWDTSRTMLGKAQRAELLSDLRKAEDDGITWKLILVPEPIQNLDAFTASDRFEGYAHERGLILDFIETECIANVVFISGDIHGTIANNLTYKKSALDPQRYSASWDISTGPVAYPPPLGGKLTFSQPGGNRTALDIAFAAEMNILIGARNRPLVGLGPDAFLVPPLLQLPNRFVPVTQLGPYVSAHTYGWTEFEIDPLTQKLLVTTHGVDWYKAGPDGAGQESSVVSQFEVETSCGCRPLVCFNDDDCCENSVCNALGCVRRNSLENSELCTTNDVCQSNICVIGVCAGCQPTGNVCGETDDCCDGHVCSTLLCVGRNSLEAAVPCTAGDACRSGICANGLCQAVCDDGICDVTEKCGGNDVTGLQCRSDCGQCENGSPCGDDNMCRSGLCNGGVCTYPQENGSVCVRDEGCQSGLCNAGTCTEPQANGSLCVRHEGCQSGLCDLGLCTAFRSRPALSPCFSGDACKNGSCTFGTCAEICGDGFCDGTEQCGGNDVTALQCRSDCGQCPNGSICGDDNMCESGLCNGGICTSPQGNGSICVRNEGCRSGLCDLGFCTALNSKGWLSPCFSGRACTSGRCSVGLCTRP